MVVGVGGVHLVGRAVEDLPGAGPRGGQQHVGQGEAEGDAQAQGEQEVAGDREAPWRKTTWKVSKTTLKLSCTQFKSTYTSNTAHAVQCEEIADFLLSGVQFINITKA